MLLTLTLAAGLLAASEPQAEPPKGKGWVVEARGFTEHRQPKYELIVEFLWPQAKPEGWIIEWRGFHMHGQAYPRIEPIETQYHDDLPAFFKQLEMQHRRDVSVETVESFYVDDLPAFIEKLKKEQP
jgi:hypothetical protein